MFTGYSSVKHHVIVHNVKMANVAVGDTFTSFEDLEKRIEEYQNQQFVQFYKRDSRTIESSIRRATNRTYNSNLPLKERGPINS